MKNVICRGFDNSVPRKGKRLWWGISYSNICSHTISYFCSNHGYSNIVALNYHRWTIVDFTRLTQVTYRPTSYKNEKSCPCLDSFLVRCCDHQCWQHCLTVDYKLTKKHAWRPSLWFALFLCFYFIPHEHLSQVLIYRIHQLSIWRYGSTLSGTLSLLFSPSGTKALMRQLIDTLFVGMAYTLPGTLALYWCASRC